MNAHPYACGFIRGTGAAVNVELGYIPDMVRVTNLTDGDLVTECSPLLWAAFTSGSVEIQKGDRIKGVTSGALANVKQVVLDSGSWAAGDAAGWIVLEPLNQSGTFSGENIGTVDADSETPSDEATLSAAPNEVGVGISTAAATVNTDATTVQAYTGSQSASVGFTIGATVSENAKLLFWEAFKTTVAMEDVAAP